MVFIIKVIKFILYKYFIINTHKKKLNGIFIILNVFFFPLKVDN